jgi:hypothetical protein
MGVVTLSVSTSRTATLGSLATGAEDEMSGFATTERGTRAFAAIDVMRKWRLFMRVLHCEYQN